MRLPGFLSLKAYFKVNIDIFALFLKSVILTVGDLQISTCKSVWEVSARSSFHSIYDCHDSSENILWFSKLTGSAKAPLAFRTINKEKHVLVILQIQYSQEEKGVQHSFINHIVQYVGRSIYSIVNSSTHTFHAFCKDLFLKLPVACLISSCLGYCDAIPTESTVSFS